METLERALKLMSDPHTYFNILRNRREYLCSLNKDISELDQTLNKLGNLSIQYHILTECYCTPFDNKIDKSSYHYKDLRDILIYQAYHSDNKRHREITREIINVIEYDYKQVVTAIIL